MSGSHMTPHNAAVTTPLPSRRPVSIFSRRGTGTPVSTYAALPPSLQHLRGGIRGTLREQLSEQSACGTSIISQDPSSRQKKATILNAVPPADNSSYRSLKSARPATTSSWLDSDDDIPSDAALSPDSHLPGSQFNVFWENDSSPALTPSRKTGRTDDARIGLWVDGVAFWDDEDVSPISKSSASYFEKRGSSPSPTLLESHTGYVSPKHAIQAEHRSGAHVMQQPRPQRPTGPRPNTRERLESSASASSTSRACTYATDAANRSSVTLDSPSRPRAPTTSEEKSSRRSHSSSRETSSSELDSVYSKSSSATSLDTCDPSDSPTHEASLTPDKSLRFKTAHGARYNLVVGQQLDSQKIDSILPTLAPVQSTPKVHNIATPSLISTRPFLRSQTQLQIPDPASRARPALQKPDAGNSPTLSQAEYDLQAHLATIAEHEKRRADLQAIRANLKQTQIDETSDAVDVETMPPLIPKKSRKRDWRLAPDRKQIRSVRSVTSLSISKTDDQEPETASIRTVSDLFRSNSVQHHTGPHRGSLVVPDRSARLVQASLTSPLTPTNEVDVDVDREEAEQSHPPMTTASAKTVILSLLSSMPTLQDLSNLARVNRSMYSIFRENENLLVQAVNFNQSPAAWEYQEWASNDDHTSQGSQDLGKCRVPLSYTQSLHFDSGVIDDLGKVILERCSTFIRKETGLAISTSSHPGSQRFKDALWRIWSFCTIFGCRKGREEDITGQLDWLRGGLMASNEACETESTALSSCDLDSAILNAPDHFAKGNADGLTAAQLFDMTELWTCLCALLQNYTNHIDAARYYGVFDDKDVTLGDLERETFVLEEWTAYLLSLGPAVVLAMAQHATNSKDCLSGFALAQARGWTQWTLSKFDGSRVNFLKEPLARLYEERTFAAGLNVLDPTQVERNVLARQHIATLGNEIRLRRQESGYKRLPLIDMYNERAMSMGSIYSTISASTPSLPSTCYSMPPRQQRLSPRPASPTPSAKSPLRPVFHSHLADPTGSSTTPYSPLSPRCPSPAWTTVSTSENASLPNTPRIALQHHHNRTIADFRAVTASSRRSA